MFSLFSFLLFSCDPQKKPFQSNSASLEGMPEAIDGLTDIRIQFYKQDFPKAASFRKREISSVFLSDIDKGNNLYYEVLDSAGELIGYLRDFMGPVTADEECACSPLSLTLTFNPDLTLRNILSVNPLQKYGHEPLTEEEHKQMVSIAQNPSDELFSLLVPQDMIDGVSGATKLTFKDKVVDKAGYSTWRISKLAMDTAGIIEGSPRQRDADRLRQMLQTAETDAEQRSVIVEFIPMAESDYLKMRALSILAEIYLKGLSAGELPDDKTQNMLLNPGLGAYKEAEFLINICTVFVEQKVGLSFVSECINTLESNPQRKKFESEILILKGLTFAADGRVEEALPILEQGLSIGGPSPMLRQKLAVLYKERNQMEEYCNQIEQMYIDAPRWPSLDDIMSSCGDATEIKEGLQESRRTAIVEAKVQDPKVVSPMQIMDESGKRLTIDLSKEEKVHVLVFFATWCPHCQQEMPNLVAFYEQLQESDLKDVVEFMPIRAAISREYQTLDSFKEQYKIPFPILTDEGLVFEYFAGEQEIRPAYPTIAIVDKEGKVVYLPSHGQYNEPVQELFWMVESLAE